MSCYTFVYLRRSSDEDDRQALSLEAQEALCQDYVQRQRYTVQELIRESHSAKAPGRPLFAAMLKKAERLQAQGRAVRILAHKPDRLVRNYPDWAQLSGIWQAGLQLEFVTGSFPNNAQGRMAMGIMVVMATHYVENLSEEVQKGLLQKLALGQWPGWAPVGYLNIPNPAVKERIVIDPVSGPLLKQALMDFSTGEYSVERLAGKYLRLGLLGRNGQPLGKSTLHRALTNPFYCGLMRYKGQVVPASHEPLISVTCYRRIQEVLAGRHRARRQRHTFRYSGLFHCGHCGCAVVGELKKGRYVYYRCSHRRPCAEGYIRQERLDTLLRLRLRRTLRLAPVHIDELRAAAAELAKEPEAATTARESLVRRQGDLERRKENLIDMRVAGLITDDEFLARKSELELAAAQCSEELAALELPHYDAQTAVELFIQTCQQVETVLDDGTDTEIRSLLRIVCSNFRYSAETVDFEPEKPFDLAAQARNRPIWRAGRDDVRTLVDAISQWQETHNTSFPPNQRIGNPHATKERQFLPMHP